jgi:hypothetical protein
VRPSQVPSTFMATGVINRDAVSPVLLARRSAWRWRRVGRSGFTWADEPAPRRAGDGPSVVVANAGFNRMLPAVIAIDP